jgi:hypothetical protein
LERAVSEKAEEIPVIDDWDCLDHKRKTFVGR